MASLAERYRAAQAIPVAVGGWQFTLRRPTDYEIETGRPGGWSIPWVAGFVTGWAGVLESDILPGGNPEPAAFDPVLFALWVQDHPELWAPLSSAVADAYQSWSDARQKKGEV